MEATVQQREGKEALQQAKDLLVKALSENRSKDDQLQHLQEELKSFQGTLTIYEKEKTRLFKENKRLRKNLEIVREQEEEVRERIIVDKQATTRLEKRFASQQHELEQLREEFNRWKAEHKQRLQQDATMQTEASCSQDDIRVLHDLLSDVQAIAQGTSQVAYRTQARQ